MVSKAVSKFDTSGPSTAERCQLVAKLVCPFFRTSDDSRHGRQLADLTPPRRHGSASAALLGLHGVWCLVAQPVGSPSPRGTCLLSVCLGVCGRAEPSGARPRWQTRPARRTVPLRVLPAAVSAVRPTAPPRQLQVIISQTFYRFLHY